jgi:hypothetical protein
LKRRSQFDFVCYRQKSSGYLGLFSWLLGAVTNRRRRFALAEMQVAGSGAKKTHAEARLE